MTDLFPELAKLSGGRKQNWITTNRDLILALYDKFGFEDTARMLHMKQETLTKALQRTEASYRPAITQAEKAMLLAQRADIKADQALGELETQAEVIEGSINEVSELKANLARYFGLMARAHTIMEELMSSVAHVRDLTYHINSQPTKKVGPSVSRGRARLFLSCPGHRTKYPGQLSSNTHRPRRIRGVY